MEDDLSIFDFEDDVQIILNKEVLSPDYIPPRIIGRDEQIKQIASLMKYLIKGNGDKAENALIFGPPGCGKTVVSKCVLNTLMAKLERDPIPVNVDWVYIHCKKVYTSTSVLYTLIQHLDPRTKVPRCGYSLDYYYNELFKLMNTKNTALIVILDEIDFLRSDNVLYNFSRAIANEELFDGRFISIIGLSNSTKYEETLDDRIISSMGFKKFRFPSYYADPIYHILLDRINLAFAPNSISEELLMDCSEDAANAGGDIRKALCVLEEAAELAVDNGECKISKEYLTMAEEKVHIEEIINSVVGLPRHHKIILASIIKLVERSHSVYTGEVIKMYRLLCKQVSIKPLDDSTVSKSISSLEMQSFIRFTKVNIGSRGGISRLISVSSTDITQMKQGIYDDFKLEDLIDYFPTGYLSAIQIERR